MVFRVSSISCFCDKILVRVQVYPHQDLMVVKKQKELVIKPFDFRF